MTAALDTRTGRPNPTAPTAPADGQRFLLQGVGWAGYRALAGLLGDRPVRLTYDRGDLELMSPSSRHERIKGLLGRMVETLTEELERPCIAAGSTTFRRADLDRGLEPDECFYLAHAEAIRARDAIDPAVDPPPDLAIEVDITAGSLDRLGIYAALGVPEVWRFDGRDLQILRLGPQGRHEAVGESPAFPGLMPAEIGRFLAQGEGMDHSRWGRAFRAWVREVYRPRTLAGAGGGD